VIAISDQRAGQRLDGVLDPVERHVSQHGQRCGGGPVALGREGLHVRQPEMAQALVAAADRPGVAVLGREERLLDGPGQLPHGAVLVALAQLVADHLLLDGEHRLRHAFERRQHDLGFELQGLAERSPRHHRDVGGGVVIGEGVDAGCPQGPQAIGERLIPLAGPEGQVLEKMGEPLLTGRVVAAADTQDQGHGHHPGAGDSLMEEPESARRAPIDDLDRQPVEADVADPGQMRECGRGRSALLLGPGGTAQNQQTDQQRAGGLKHAAYSHASMRCGNPAGGPSPGASKRSALRRARP
jgi:hypothetical protein